MSHIKLFVFKLKPLTPLFFRTPHPFDVGGHAEGANWPQPSTIAGMIRSAAWDVSRLQFSADDLASQPEFTGVKKYDNEYVSSYNFDWRIVGPYLYCEEGGNVYYPSPLDLISYEDGDRKVVEFADRTYSNELKDMIDFHYEGLFLNKILTSKRKIIVAQTLDNTFIRQDILRSLLEGTRDRFELDDSEKHHPKVIISVSDVIEETITSHISLDDRKILKVKDGRGYYFRIKQIHLREGWNYVFGIISLNSKLDEYFKKLDNHIARFGGEGGFVKISRDDDIELIEKLYLNKLDDQLPSKFRFMLTSPAVFIDGDHNVPRPNTRGIRIFGYAIKKFIIGGWDYLNNRIKAMHFGVDKGSVFYAENVGNLSYRDIVAKRVHIPSDFRGAYGSSLISML